MAAMECIIILPACFFLSTGTVMIIEGRNYNCIDFLVILYIVIL